MLAVSMERIGTGNRQYLGCSCNKLLYELHVPALIGLEQALLSCQPAFMNLLGHSNPNATAVHIMCGHALLRAGTFKALKGWCIKRGHVAICH